jgi:diadenosine tetraphosphate (Ap4A) HIT family hydrolase
MVFPVRHVTSMIDLTAAERKDFMDIICDYESKGYSVYSRAPSTIARTVPHIHTHLIKVANEAPRIYLALRKPYSIVRW